MLFHPAQGQHTIVLDVDGGDEFGGKERKIRLNKRSLCTVLTKHLFKQVAPTIMIRRLCDTLAWALR